MAKFRLRNDSWNIRFTKNDDTTGLFADQYAEGSGNLEFILVDTSGDDEGACGLDDLPLLGSNLHSLAYYNQSAAGIEYSNIRAVSITLQPLLASDPNKPVYVIEYSSEGFVVTPNNVEEFTSEIVSISIDDPTKWRYAETINPFANTAPTGVNSIQSSVQQRIFKYIVQGSFKVPKVVHSSQIGLFWVDVKDIIGKLNTEEIFLYNSSQSNSIYFNRGQVQCSGCSQVSKAGEVYKFDVFFSFRLINDSTPGGFQISSDDWNYVLSSIGTAGGWLLPVKVGTADSTTLTSNPYVYPYATLNDFTTLMSADYSTDIEA